MQGILILLLCWLAGNGLSMLIGGYLSGNIIGMVLLFVLLRLGWVSAERVRPAAKFLLGIMALFFVPFGVGLMISYGPLLENLTAVVVAIPLCTALVLVSVGWTFQLLNRKKSDR